MSPIPGCAAQAVMNALSIALSSASLLSVALTSSTPGIGRMMHSHITVNAKSKEEEKATRRLCTAAGDH